MELPLRLPQCSNQLLWRFFWGSSTLGGPLTVCHGQLSVSPKLSYSAERWNSQPRNCTVDHQSYKSNKRRTKRDTRLEDCCNSCKQFCSCALSIPHCNHTRSQNIGKWGLKRQIRGVLEFNNKEGLHFFKKNDGCLWSIWVVYTITLTLRVWRERFISESWRNESPSLL